MTLSIIIPTFNRSQILRNLLDALTHDTRSLAAIDHEIIVVDDRSTDNTYEMVTRDFPSVRIVQGPGKNAEAAKRVAIENTQSDFIVSLDDDCIPRSGWIATALPALEGGEKIVQCKLVFHDLGQKELHDESSAHFRVGFRFDMMPLAQLNGGFHPQYIEFCHEFGCFFAREVLNKVPLDDPNLVGDKFGSSASFSLRAKKLGYKIFFEPASIVDHWGALSGGFAERVKKVHAKKQCTPYVIDLIHNFFLFGRLYRPLRIPLLIPYYFLGGLYLSVKQRKNCLKYFIRGIVNGLTAPIQEVIPYKSISSR